MKPGGGAGSLVGLLVSALLGIIPLPGSRTSKAAQPEGGESCPEVSRWENLPLPTHPGLGRQQKGNVLPAWAGLRLKGREEELRPCWGADSAPREVSAGRNFTSSKEQALGSECAACGPLGLGVGRKRTGLVPACVLGTSAS